MKLKIGGLIGAVALIIAGTSCGGNLSPRQNCDLTFEILFNQGWFAADHDQHALYDAYWEIVNQGHAVIYWCQVIDLNPFSPDFGFQVWGWRDNDSIIGGDNNYYLVSAPEDRGLNRFTLPGTAAVCAGQDVTPSVPGQKCMSGGLP